MITVLHLWNYDILFILLSNYLQSVENYLAIIKKHIFIFILNDDFAKKVWRLNFIQVKSSIA